MFRNRSVGSGFTIVELLVVIVVIGILAAISVVSYNGIAQKAKTTALQSDLTNAKKTLQMYQVENGSYPTGIVKDTGCPTPADTKYCLKSSPGVDMSYINNDPQKFIVNGSNGSLLLGSVTESTSPSIVSLSGSVKFDYTGNIVNWTVPAGVTKINIITKGAQGGYVNYEANVFDPNTGEWLGAENKATIGGKGAYVSADFTVTPGQVLSILVGQQPDSPASDYGYSFPGGGGGTFVALGSNYTTATPLLVAGGGGAAAGDWWGFGDTGQGGQVSNINSSGDGGGYNPGTNGNGAPSVECAGGGGGFYTSGGNDTMYYNGFESPDYAGVGAGGLGFRQGGAGGQVINSTNLWLASSYQSGGFGGGSIADYIGYCNTTAGSGGGYSGGASASSGLDYGGAGTNLGKGGGSYILSSATNQFSAADTNTGNGQVVINWQ
jgi:prepilin-type N-terminal cleavage/methylation domain-containing protein